MARGFKSGGRTKESGTKAAKLEQRCRDLGVDVELFFVDTMQGKMTCSKCLGSKRMPGVDAKRRALKLGVTCDRCGGSGREILEAGERMDAAAELYARIAGKLKSVELGVGLGGKKGTIPLAEALMRLAGVR